MKRLIQLLGSNRLTGAIFRGLCILIGTVVICLWWAWDTLCSLFCLHLNCYPVDDEYIMCGKCNKEIWSPWGFK